ncbi:MAG: pilus assembly protein TadG-related protein [Anaerolineales bacterium]
MKIDSSEKGQALIVITLAAVVLFGFAALAIDGSRAFSDKRHAQSAADTAALAGALAYAQGGDLTTVAQARATSNSYDGGTMSDVTITATDVPSGGCPGNALGKDITVDIVSYVNTSFGRVIGRNQLTNAVTAKTRACGYFVAPLFNGHAIVSLKDTSSPCAFDSCNSNSARWKIEGSGLFSNGCAFSKNGNSVTFVDPGDCATTVGTATGFASCTPQLGQAINYPADVLAIMPENPCDGTPGDVGLAPPASGSTFTNGIYCISDLDDYDQEDIHLDNATLYVTDTDFNMKFAGSGGFSGTATNSGDYEDYYMIIAYDPTPCQAFNDNNAQVIQYRGNGTGSFKGTVLAPSACIDLRGNGEASGLHTQIIGYIVSSNGNAEVYINYQVDENHQEPVEPTVQLLQ